MTIMSVKRPSVQWQPDGLTNNPHQQEFLGAGFLGGPPISLIRIAKQPKLPHVPRRNLKQRGRPRRSDICAAQAVEKRPRCPSRVQRCARADAPCLPRCWMVVQSHHYCDKKVATMLFEQLFKLCSVVVVFSSKLFELIRVVGISVVILVGPNCFSAGSLPVSLVARRAPFSLRSAPFGSTDRRARTHLLGCPGSALLLREQRAQRTRRRARVQALDKQRPTARYTLIVIHINNICIYIYIYIHIYIYIYIYIIHYDNNNNNNNNSDDKKSSNKIHDVSNKGRLVKSVSLRCTMFDHPATSKHLLTGDC